VPSRDLKFPKLRDSPFCPLLKAPAKVYLLSGKEPTVDVFFDRLGRVLRSIFSEDEDRIHDDPSSRRGFVDPDMDEAYEELDEFLKTGKNTEHGDRQRQHSYSRSTGSNSGKRQGEELDLMKDYKTLEVPFGAPFEEVKKSYKRLLRQYHPDKHAHDPEKLKTATEITQRINVAFAHIETYENKRHGKS
jgi:hypothetical protein